MFNHSESPLITKRILPNDGGKNGLLITPNPATGDVLAHFAATKSGLATIDVIDATGKAVLIQEIQLTKGKNSININRFITLVEGSYTIRLVTNSKTYTSSFLIWK